MRPADSRAEYTERIHRVLAHIDQHLDQPLELATLAEVAHFSPFHFHRLFAAWMGETLGDYLRRRRVEFAAMRLVSQPRLALLEVALGVGFGSGEAFSRAFKARFGAAPSSWRAEQLALRRQGWAPAGMDSNPDQAHRKPGQAAQAGATHHGGPQTTSALPAPPAMPLDVKLVTLQPVPIAYLRYTGPYGDAVGRFWGDTVYPWMLANQLVGAPRYGVSHDDPSITDPAICRYDACVEVTPDVVLSGTPQRTVLPGGRYAVAPFKGRSAQVDATWRALLRDWLPASGLQLDNRPCFEYYPPDGEYDECSGAFSCDICIAVAPL